MVQSASPLFLRDAEMRRGAELLYFGYGHIFRRIDRRLSGTGLGRAHQRALHIVARQPDITSGSLMRLLNVTKQSLGRVIRDLVDRGFLESRTGSSDRRHRLLRLTPSGATLERELFALIAAPIRTAYANAGEKDVAGFWLVLENLLPPAEQRRVAKLGGLT